MRKFFGSNTETEKPTEMEKNLNWLVNGIDFEHRRIEIRGDVNEQMASHITRGLIRMADINLEPVTIIMSSPGGDVYEGMSIYDAIVDCPCDVHIKATGKIMSMGFVILLAGKTRTATANTRFMMHSISFGTEGTTKDNEISVNEGKVLNNQLIELFGEKTKRNKKWWQRNILSHDKFFSVAEAKEIGILTLERPAVIRKKVIAKPVVKKGKR